MDKDIVARVIKRISASDSDPSKIMELLEKVRLKHGKFNATDLKDIAGGYTTSLSAASHMRGLEVTLTFRKGVCTLSTSGTSQMTPEMVEEYGGLCQEMVQLARDIEKLLK